MNGTGGESSSSRQAGSGALVCFKLPRQEVGRRMGLGPHEWDWEESSSSREACSGASVCLKLLRHEVGGRIRLKPDERDWGESSSSR